MPPTVASVLLTVGLSIVVAGSAAAHGGGSHADPGGVIASAAGTKVKLRGCLLSAAFVPRPAEVLQPVFRRPLDLSQTFYGPDPLLGVWGMSCDGGRVAGKRTGRIAASMVAVPVGLTSPEAVPLANNFAQALIRIDTSSRVLAAALRRKGLPGKVAPKIRYSHSPRGEVPLRGRLVVPGGYSVRVEASDLDPTNPHDHVNRFEYRGAGRRRGTLDLAIDDAIDRFCFPASGTCAASLRAPRRTPIARLLGGRSAEARAAFDHEKLPRIDLVLRALKARAGGPTGCRTR